MKKKFVFIIITLIYILSSVICPLSVSAITFTPDFEIYSDSAILINLDTNNVVFEKNADKQQVPAQLVNIMTAIICIENCSDLKTTITADNELYADIYSYGYPDEIRYGDIYNGDVLTVEDLLYSLMLSSASDAANILAYYIGGNSIKSFVAMMNAKAQEIGATSTNFTNAHGLYDPSQVSTARDMAKITQYALKNPSFEKIATTQSYIPSIPNTENGHGADWYWTHSNTMMANGDYYYAGVKGIKTGNLEKAGRNIITMASVDGINYLVVLMNAPLNDESGQSRFYHLEDAKNIFDWAFAHIKYQTIISDTEEINEIPVKFGSGDDNYVLLKPAEEFSTFWLDTISLTSIQKEINTNLTTIIAPIEKGEKLGTLDLKLSGETIGTVDLIATSSVKRSKSKYNMAAAKQFKNSKWFELGIISAAALSAIYILICILSYRISTKRKPVRGVYTTKKTKKNTSIHNNRRKRR